MMYSQQNSCQVFLLLQELLNVFVPRNLYAESPNRLYAVEWNPLEGEEEGGAGEKESF